MAQMVLGASHGFSFGHLDSLVVLLRLNCSAANGFLVPQPRIEPSSPALQGGFFFFFARWILNRWTAREVPPMINILKSTAHKLIVVVVQAPGHVQLFVTPWTTACQASLSLTISQSLLKLMSIELVMLYNHLILCC